jgi:hypothetical protein
VREVIVVSRKIGEGREYMAENLFEPRLGNFFGKKISVLPKNNIAIIFDDINPLNRQASAIHGY